MVYMKRQGLQRKQIMKPLQNIEGTDRKHGYMPEQVYNADETILFWKRMPSCTSIAKEETKTRGLKPGKDKLQSSLFQCFW